MTGNDVYEIIRSAAGSMMAAESNLRFMADKNMQAGDGITGGPDQNGIVSSIIGVAGLKNSTDVISDGKAAAFIVAAFHEGCGHGFQWLHEFGKTTPLSKTLASNCVACAVSEPYYGVDRYGHVNDSYFMQPHEVAAQYSGLLHARAFLKGMYGRERADELIVSCELWRRENGCSYLPDDVNISSADAIMSSYRTHFKNRIHAHRAYREPSVADRPYLIDAVADFKAANAAHYDMDVLVGNCNDGLLQDVRVAAVGRWRNRYQPDVLNKLFNNDAITSIGIMTDAGLMSVMRSDTKPFHTWPEPVSMSLLKLHVMTQEMERFGRDPPKQDVPGFE